MVRSLNPRPIHILSRKPSTRPEYRRRSIQQPGVAKRVLSVLHPLGGIHVPFAGLLSLHQGGPCGGTMTRLIQSVAATVLAVVALIAFVFVFWKIYGQVTDTAILQAAFKPEDQKPPVFDKAITGLAGALATLVGGAALAVFAKKDSVVADKPENRQAAPLKALQSLGVLASTPKKADDPGVLQLVVGSVYLVIYLAVAVWGGYIWFTYATWTPEVVTTFVGGVVGVIGPTVLALFGATQAAPAPAPAPA